MNRYKKQNELRNRSYQMRQASYKATYEKAQEIREEQTKEWNKFVFYKNLNKTLELIKW